MANCKLHPVGLDKSSAISSLAEANAFIVLPGGTRGFEAGIIFGIIIGIEHRK